MTSFFLFLHLLGAVLTGYYILKTGIAIFKNTRHMYSPLAIKISFITCYQLITGSLLALAATHGQSIFAFCSRIGIYLLFVGIAEGMLFWKMKNVSLIFPQKYVFSPIGLGMAIVLVTIILL